MILNRDELTVGENKLILEGEAGKIEAILHLPTAVSNDLAVKAMMICCHPHPLFEGAMTNKIVHIICKTFCKLGMPVLRFNFRGVGQSEGNHDKGVGESKDLLDLCALMAESWPEHELWLAGFSFGSWIAANTAEAAGAKQLLSVAPPVQHFDFDNFNKPSCPWLVLMGDEDEVVDPTKVYQWIDNYNDDSKDNLNQNQVKKPELIRFPDSGHFFHGKMVEMSKRLEEHYGPLLKGLN